MTTLKYLNDTYLFESYAIIQKVEKHEDRIAIILDETIFYPQGGGQPTDCGSIKNDKLFFEVTEARLDVSGQVLHYGILKEGNIIEGDKVSLKINSEKRMLHARLHSAGHLLDCAVSELEINHLKPTKGYHFLNGSYVEYDGILDTPSELIADLETKINLLVAKNVAIKNKELSFTEAQEHGIWAPEGRSARVVYFDGFPYCGCGGTHVQSSKEIGTITIRKIKSKKGITRISYKLNND